MNQIARQAASEHRNRTRQACRAFTMVEILVAVSVLVILLGIALRGGGLLVERSRISQAEALMSQVDVALDAFAEVNPFQRNRGLSRRYGAFPPDEMHVFDVHGDDPQGVTAVQPWPSDNNYPELVHRPPDGGDHLEFEDWQVQPASSSKAMVLAMRLYAPAASTIIDRLNSKARAFDLLNPSDPLSEPESFVPSPGDAAVTLEYIVDPWGQPLRYFNTRLADPASTSNVRWRFSALAMQICNGRPLLMSYGPDGPDQFEGDVSDTDIILDALDADGKINHPFNQDNVYSSDTFRDRMME